MVELFVVLALIAILISILIPSLAKTLSLAEDMKCKNNLGQTSQAMQLFIDDNDGILPGPFWAGHSARFGKNKNTSKYSLPRHFIPYLLEEKDDHGNRYMKTFLCPTVEQNSNNPLNRIFRISYFTPHWHRGLGMRPFGRPKSVDGRHKEISPISMSKITNPEKHFVMEDADIQNMPWVSSPYLTQYPTHFQSYRNRNYFDGHVDQEDWYLTP